jgi:DNA repair protein RadC
MYGIFLNSKNRMVGIEKLFSGSITGASVYPREIVKRMITLKANALILAHNHPSGCTLPSPEDQHITFRVAMALSVLDACLHDHIIIGDDFYSMADAGFMKTINAKVKQILSSGPVKDG